MDGVTVGGTPVSASALLRAEAAALSVSAERDQIEPGGTLGHWLRGQQMALVALAALADHIDETAARLEERVHATIKNTRELSISEVHRLQKATALAEATTKSLQATEAVVKVRTEQAIGNLIASMKPDLIKALRATTVIREQSWNRRQNMMGVTGLACLLVGLFGIGYLMGGGDFRSRSAGNEAQAAVARCFAAARPNPIVATSTCRVVTLIEPGG